MCYLKCPVCRYTVYCKQPSIYVIRFLKTACEITQESHFEFSMILEVFYLYYQLQSVTIFNHASNWGISLYLNLTVNFMNLPSKYILSQ